MANVVIYTRKLCGFCTAAKSLLHKKGASFREIDATFSADLKQEMIEKARGRATFPQVFIGDEHIGGYDELNALERMGKLDAKLAA